MLGADNAGHATHLRPMASNAEPAKDRSRAALGKHSRTEDSANTSDQAATAPIADLDRNTGAADISAPESDAEGNAPLRTIGDEVAALPTSGDKVLRTTDAQPAAEVDAEEAITADSLTVLLSQVWHVFRWTRLAEASSACAWKATSTTTSQCMVMNFGFQHSCGKLELRLLLVQVLRSQDRAMLERCFAVSSEDVINNTVRRLSSPDAVLLLRAAIQRLQSRPLRGEQLQTWIRAMLVSHTAYFISAPGAHFLQKDADFMSSAPGVPSRSP